MVNEGFLIKKMFWNLLFRHHYNWYLHHHRERSSQNSLHIAFIQRTRKSIWS